MPTLGERVEGAAVVSISHLQLTQSPGPCHTVSTQHFCLGWLPSPPLPLLAHRQLLFVASSSFLPLTGQKKGTHEALKTINSKQKVPRQSNQEPQTLLGRSSHIQCHL